MSRKLHLALFTLLFFLLPLWGPGGHGTCLRAQTHDVFAYPTATTRFFPISAELAGKLIDEDYFLTPLSDLGAPLPPETTEQNLPAGHFLEATVSAGRVRYTYHQRHGYEILVRNRDGRFDLRLFRDGEAVTNADVRADGRRVRYRRGAAAYQRRDWRIDQLRIAHDGDTLFYQIDESVGGSRAKQHWYALNRFAPTYVLLTPARVADRTVDYARRVIRDGNWRWYRYPFQRYIRRLINPTPVAGYK